MISINDDGLVEIKGKKMIVRAQLVALINDMIEEDMFSKKEMKDIVETACLSREELNSRLEGEKKKCAEIFGEDFVKQAEKSVIEMFRKEMEK